MMAAFDQPDAMTSCPVRPVSTHALQALSLFNSDFMREQSQPLRGAAGARMRRDDCAFQLRRAYKLALARAPKAGRDEDGQASSWPSGGKLADFCLALLNRNEFVYVP